jgi:hemerythrin-like domain-containing protein
MTTTTHTQLLLPGQTHAAEGPHDMTGMYVAHHGFRRDLAAFEAAVRNTPVDEVDVWRLLRRRWDGFATVLHHHHELEDEFYWPAMLRRAEELGDAQAVTTLTSMEAEHDEIDPALAACEAGLGAMAAHPCPAHRDRLDADLTRTRAALLDHLRHEETEAIPLMQQILPADDWDRSEKAALSTFPKRFVPFLVGWGLHGLPADAAARMTAMAGPGYVLVHRLVRRSWERRERRTFRYA